MRPLDKGDTSEIIDPDINTSESHENDSVLSVAIFNFPPYINVLEEEINGPSISILHEIFNRLGYVEHIDYELVEYPFPRILELLKTGEIDIVTQIMKTPERLDYLDYTNEYHAQEQLVFITFKDKNIDFDGNLNNLHNLVIGSVRGASNGPVIDQAVSDGILSIDTSKDSTANVTKLLAGRVDIIIDIKAVAEANLVNMDQLSEVRFVDPPIINNYSYIAFSKTNNLTDLRDQFDETLKDIHEDGTEKQIYFDYYENQ